MERLVAFGTRHTLSSQDDPVRGIGAARRWAEAQLRATGEACGGCLTIDLPETILPVSARVPSPTRLVDVLAIQKGTERPDEVVIIQGHIDTRASDPLNASIDAPGANDDGSGTALVLEAAASFPNANFRPPSSMPCFRARSRDFWARACWPPPPPRGAGR
jgi:acetylornithine deacetylase/succinyl-diaminopimelate desuccinylase-like protein